MLKTLLLRNFRNYSEQKIDFSPKRNLIFGENAQGKTNLLEAIYLVSTGRSFRTPFLSELIQHQKSFFYLEAQIEKNGIEQTIKIYYDRKIKKLTIDGHSFTSFSPLLGLLPSVLHTSQDLSLISGSPSLRRRFIDLHISQHDKIYLHHLIRFYQAKKQRDVLLKSKQTIAMDCFEEQMAEAAIPLIKKRIKMVEEIENDLLSFGKQLSFNQDEPRIRYSLSTSSDETQSSYQEILKKNREKEFAFGNTIQGPHRDDFYFTLDQKQAKPFASEGQKRSCILALRLAEWKRLFSYTDFAIFCIDDIQTHFDIKRQEALNEELKKLTQVFITIPNPDLNINVPCSKFFIKQGNIETI